jgi:hypothetical protein
MGFVKSRTGFLLISSLPLLHLCLSVATGASPDTGWNYIDIVDFPASIAAVGLAWLFNEPLWIFVIFTGTLWWCLISFAIALLSWAVWWLAAKASCRNKHETSTEYRR